MSTPEHLPDLLLDTLLIPRGVAERDLPVRYEPPADRTDLCRPTYLIAMTARTGSTALREHIARSGVLGNPRECFNPRGFIRRHLERSGAETIADILAIARRRTATDNGCFGVTTNFWSFFPFLASGLYQVLFAETRFVHLSRRDLLAQAISLHIAKTSGVFHRRSDGKVFGPAETARPVPLDLAAVAGHLRSLAQEDANWRSFFAATGIEPLRLVYEDIADDLSAAVTRIGDHLGIAIPPLAEPEAGLERLSSSLNLELKQRFRNACRVSGDRVPGADVPT